MPDNKRYVGDVFIDGKTDKLLTEFLTNLFNQYNGEGKGFNADMLDGHHYAEIEAELDRLNQEKLSEIRIGDSVFNNQTNNFYLRFTDVIYDSNQELDWNSDIENPQNITNVINGLYEHLVTMLTDGLDDKINSEQVDPNDDSDNPRMKVLSDNNFTDEDKDNLDELSENFLDSLVEYTDDNGDTYEMINSGLTNGLRFILITQAEYERLKNSNDEDEQAYVNSWRNIFIFVDNMPTAGEYDSPLNYKLTEGYHFRLANSSEPGSALNDIDENSNDPVWLQFKHNLNTEWSNIAPLDDFLYGVNLDEIITDKIEDGAVLSNALDNVLNDSESENYLEIDYLPLSYKDDFIHQICKDGLALSTNIDENGFANIDISNAFSDELSTLDTKINDLSNSNQTGTLDIQLQDLSSSINQLDTTINGNSNTAVLKQLSSIQQSVSGIQAQINSLQSSVTELNNYNTWIRKDVPGLRYINNGTTYQSHVLYNPKLQLAMFYFNFEFYNLKDDKNWAYRQINATTSTVDVLYAHPYGSITFVCNDSPTTFLNVNSSGELKIRSTATNNGKRRCWGQIIYRYSSLG